MSRSFLRAAACLLLMCCGISVAGISSASNPDILLETMQRELQRATNSLKKADPSPYFLSYAVADTAGVTIIGTNSGSVLSTGTSASPGGRDDARRYLHAPDNTHGQSRPSAITSGTLPLEDDSDAIARVLWQLTDHEYNQSNTP